MSAQAGVFYMDRRPIPLEVVERIDDALADFGPDGGGSHLEPGLLMLSRALHITPEDEREERPLVSPAGRVLTWDGRLDNRDDLLLQFHRDLEIDATDGALALAAFERWGVDGFARLIGDWSLALWDAPERRLVLASDYMGVRPLYYRRAADHVAWSSSLGELILREGVKDDLDDVFVVGFLVGFVPADRTPYLPVRSVTPAHALSFSAAGTTCHRFYEYPANTVRYRHEWEYEEHLRDVFARAVGARLRSTRPVWADLSGGLDSSSVVCLADWLIRRGVVDALRLRTVSMVSDESPEVDERRFIAVVDEARSSNSELVAIDDVGSVYDGDLSWVTPASPRWASLAKLRRVHLLGGKLLMTGQGGDVVLANDPDWSHAALECLDRWEVLTFLRQLHAWALATKKPVAALLAANLRVALPTSWRATARARRSLWMASSRSAGCQTDVLSFTAKADALNELRQAVYAEAAAVEKSTRATVRFLLSRLIRCSAERGLQTPSELCGPRLTHPYMDRRLVECVCAFPQSVLNLPGETRSLMRRAFGRFLPPRIASRFSKGYAAPYWSRVLSAVFTGLGAPSHWELIKQGFVSEAALENALRGEHSVHQRSEQIVGMLVGAERWLRAHAALSTSSSPERGAAHSNPTQKGGEYHEVREA